MIILKLDKVNFRVLNVQIEIFNMIKESVHQEEIIIIKVCMHIKQLKIFIPTIIVCDF